MMKYRLLINVTEDEQGRRPYRSMSGPPLGEGEQFVHTWTGEIAEQPTLFHAAEVVFHDMNVDSRPTGQICPSMSVGDVVVFKTPEGEKALACASMGFAEVEVPTEILDTTWRALMDQRDKRDRLVR
jgi:hypothetical protein